MMLEKKRYKQMMMAGNLEGLFALFVKIQVCVRVCVSVFHPIPGEVWIVRGCLHSKHV